MGQWVNRTKGQRDNEKVGLWDNGTIEHWDKGKKGSTKGQKDKRTK